MKTLMMTRRTRVDGEPLEPAEMAQSRVRPSFYVLRRMYCALKHGKRWLEVAWPRRLVTSAKRQRRLHAASEAYRVLLASQGGYGGAVGARQSYGGVKGATRAQCKAKWSAMASAALRCGQCEGGGRQWRVREREGVTEPSRTWSPYAHASTPRWGPDDGQRQPRGGHVLSVVDHHGAMRDGH